MKDNFDFILDLMNYNDGFFIECGANNGVVQSYTYELERQRNWSGILIEPSIEAFNSCISNRSNKNSFYNFALVSDDSTTEVLGDFNGNYMSSVNGKRLNSKNLISVNSITLTSILDELKIDKIDLFSLDVEGYELEVLKGLDFSKYSPNYIIIEIYSDDYSDIVELMTFNDYKLEFNLTGFNKNDSPGWDGTHNDYLFKKK